MTTDAWDNVRGQMAAALTEQTKRIQLIYQVDNTFAKSNITLNDTHDFFSAVPVSEYSWKIVRPHTYGWAGHIQRRVNHL